MLPGTWPRILSFARMFWFFVKCSKHVPYVWCAVCVCKLCERIYVSAFMRAFVCTFWILGVRYSCTWRQACDTCTKCMYASRKYVQLPCIGFHEKSRACKQMHTDGRGNYVIRVCAHVCVGFSDISPSASDFPFVRVCVCKLHLHRWACWVGIIEKKTRHTFVAPVNFYTWHIYIYTTSFFIHYQIAN